jgi:excisionase family DNA binding protein
VSKPEQLQPLAVDLQNAARLLGVSDSHLEKLVRAKNGPPITWLGARRLFRVASLERWLREREQADDAAPDQAGATEDE